jgi:hypothetical protein
MATPRVMKVPRVTTEAEAFQATPVSTERASPRRSKGGEQMLETTGVLIATLVYGSVFMFIWSMR